MLSSLDSVRGGGAAVTAGAGGGGGFGLSGARAGGGDVSAGSSYTVGERGPEKFTPSVSGTITPFGGGGGMTIHYSPVVQVDARSDRAAVQQDSANIMRQGQAELVALLKRYNPGLKF